MKVVFFSSVFNHHSFPFCDAMSKLCDGRFYFVETMEEEEQRRALGYHPYDREYVINMLHSEEDAKKARELAWDADVMIASVFPYELLKERLKANKLTFLCQERMFKGGITFSRWARALIFNLRKFLIFQNKPLYFLSIGKGAAEDYRRIGFYKNKSFLWAYFPPFIKHDKKALMQGKDGQGAELLFAGRLIPLKHPEFVLRAAKELLRKGYDIHLTYIGAGEMEAELKCQAQDIWDHVAFLGSMSPEQVRGHMEKANIFVFTSNSQEGWGAVVNEAMNSGCAVIAGEGAGAVSTLIRDGENGLVYHGENYAEFYKKLETLVRDRELTEKLGAAAYDTIFEQYNANIAAERFFCACEALLQGKSADLFADGIMKKLG